MLRAIYSVSCWFRFLSEPRYLLNSFCSTASLRHRPVLATSYLSQSCLKKSSKDMRCCGSFTTILRINPFTSSLSGILGLNTIFRVRMPSLSACRVIFSGYTNGVAPCNI